MHAITHHELAVIFGILGNVISFMVFLAPIPTFYQIIRKKSSDGYHAIPYSVAFFSALLLLYYGSLKSNGILIITINSFGCAIEVIYLLIYIVYASRKDKSSTLKLLFLFNLGGSSLVALVTIFLVKGSKREAVVGWICAAINICVFAAPLSIMGQVIKTKCVKYMPLSLSIFLTLNAIMWFFYGFFIEDYYIAVPNILGFLLGLAQFILYIIYKGNKNENDIIKFDQGPRMDLTSRLPDSVPYQNGQVELKIERNGKQDDSLKSESLLRSAGGGRTRQ